MVRRTRHTQAQEGTRDAGRVTPLLNARRLKVAACRRLASGDGEAS